MNGRLIRLGDIATITRGYTDPPSQYMRFGGQAVLGIGVTMASSGDVIALGKRLDAEAGRLRAALPAGLKLVEVASMPHAVGLSIDDFVEAVAEAIGIVLIVSLISLGFRTGMVVVISIPAGAGRDRARHVPIPYRLAQGIAGDADPRARPVGG